MASASARYLSLVASDSFLHCAPKIMAIVIELVYTRLTLAITYENNCYALWGLVLDQEMVRCAV